jgi:hypothetical protein
VVLNLTLLILPRSFLQNIGIVNLAVLKDAILKDYTEGGLANEETDERAESLRRSEGACPITCRKLSSQ